MVQRTHVCRHQCSLWGYCPLISVGLARHPKILTAKTNSFYMASAFKRLALIVVWDLVIIPQTYQEDIEPPN